MISELVQKQNKNINLLIGGILFEYPDNCITNDLLLNYEAIKKISKEFLIIENISMSIVTKLIKYCKECQNNTKIIFIDVYIML